MRPQPADSFEWMETPEGLALRCGALERVARHFFTTRGWRLGSPAGSDEALAAGWADVARAAGVDAHRLLRLRQVHGAAVSVRRTGATTADGMEAADILASDDRDAALAIQTADCVPILLADARSGAVAAAHAGWRGLAARVPATAVEAMATSFGSRAADLVAAIGPSISAVRYEVGPDVHERFESAGFAHDRLAAWFPAVTREDHWLFDGWLSARDQLEAAGVPAAAIHVARLCTATYPELFCSYRRDGVRAGRMAAVVRSLKCEV
jgi:YfiH family protein